MAHKPWRSRCALLDPHVAYWIEIPLIYVYIIYGNGKFSDRLALHQIISGLFLCLPRKMRRFSGKDVFKNNLGVDKEQLAFDPLVIRRGILSLFLETYI